jgi:hypothetical protein
VVSGASTLGLAKGGGAELWVALSFRGVLSKCRNGRLAPRLGCLPPGWAKSGRPRRERRGEQNMFHGCDLSVPVKCRLPPGSTGVRLRDPGRDTRSG